MTSWISVDTPDRMIEVTVKMEEAQAPRLVDEGAALDLSLKSPQTP